jgi:hypothetical protein
LDRALREDYFLQRPGLLLFGAAVLECDIALPIDNTVYQPYYYPVPREPSQKRRTTMKKHRIIWSVVLLAMALGTSASQLPQDVRTSGGENLQDESRATTLGFLRTINTAEAAEFAEQGSYASWPTLLEHQGEYLNSWLATYVPKAHFGNLPEVLPGMDLRLNAHADGRGYDAVVEDLTDKNGYAGLSDERGIIRECTFLR